MSYLYEATYCSKCTSISKEGRDVMSMNSSLIEHHSQCCHLVSVTCKINKSATHYNNMASGLLSLKNKKVSFFKGLRFEKLKVWF